MNFRLGFGPMSKDIVKLLCKYSYTNDTPLMIIASRNQIDATSGYVMTTPELRTLLDTLDTENILVCRDHCGPYFLDDEKGLPTALAIEATKRTIAYDIEQGFDLIHIDTSRVEDTYGVAEELIKFCLKLNPNIKFEFGTEENVGIAAGAIKYKEDVAFAKNFPNMQFVVAQTGSLCYEDKQAGNFDYHNAQSLVEVAESAGIKLKEHNADYLNKDQIWLRKSAGVHALNIAPQLGVIQTKLLMSLSEMYPQEWNAFGDVVLRSNRWKKWTDSETDIQKIIVAGHYCFNTPEYEKLLEVIKLEANWESSLKHELYKTLDLYSTIYE